MQNIEFQMVPPDTDRQLEGALLLADLMLILPKQVLAVKESKCQPVVCKVPGLLFELLIGFEENVEVVENELVRMVHMENKAKIPQQMSFDINQLLLPHCILLWHASFVKAQPGNFPVSAGFRLPSWQRFLYGL